MIQQDSSSYSKEDQSKFVDAWESNIEKIEKNRKIMREGRQSANLYRMLGLLKEPGQGELRKWDKIP
tara:strand:- start:1183 stop:1383 length:201 start_codon:yes stop_codon:yes gene_type:complete